MADVASTRSDRRLFSPQKVNKQPKRLNGLLYREEMLPDPGPIVDLIESFRKSKAMFAAVQMGVFEGNRDLGLAGGRLLDACCSLGLLQKEESGGYRNTPIADEYLRRESPRTLTGYIQYSNLALYPMWRQLEDAVKEGSNRWQQVFGLSGGPLFSHFFETEEKKHDFLMGMHGFGQISSATLVRAFDLSRFRHAVDLGGATGHLVMAAVEAYPGLTATVFDLPPVVEFAQQFTEGGKIGLIVGDFFADPLPPADLYCLGRILHDWTEPKIRLLLNKIFAALPPGGGLLIAEKLLTPTNVSAHMQSLNMLICTEGRERSFAEYRALLLETGFSQVEGRISGKPVDVVLAVK
jgi:acetylserotonin O-methyltransferase